MEGTTEMGIGFMRRSVMPYATVTVTAQAGGSVSGGEVYKKENRNGDRGGQ